MMSSTVFTLDYKLLHRVSRVTNIIMVIRVILVISVIRVTQYYGLIFANMNMMQI